MRTSRKLAVVGGTTATLLAGGIAFAAWTSTGTGVGSATAGSNEPLTVIGTNVVGLYPSASVTVSVSVKNNNGYRVQLDSITAGDITVDATHAAAGCTVASVNADSGTYGAADLITANTSISRPLQVHMSADADDACQGASFTVSYSASAHSA